MLLKISDDIIINTEKILSAEKTFSPTRMFCFKVFYENREEPITYLFMTEKERDSNFEKIIKEGETNV